MGSIYRGLVFDFDPPFDCDGEPRFQIRSSDDVVAGQNGISITLNREFDWNDYLRTHNYRMDNVMLYIDELGRFRDC